MSTARAAEPHAAQRAVPRTPPSWLPVAALFLIAAVVYAVLALRSPLPILFPDEFRYSHFARGIADGTGTAWRGAPANQTAMLYVYFLVPAWALLSSSVDAWQVTKVMGTVALCAQAFPVWWLARDVLDGDRRLALLCAALSLLGTWMVTSAETVTEVLAFPLSTASLCCAAMALRRPGSRLGWLALGFLALATWARLQTAVLAPALVVALLIDVVRARGPEARAARVRAHGGLLIVAGAAFLLAALVALAAPDAFGDYGGFFHFRPDLGRIVDKSALQLAELAAVAGFLPVLLAAGAAVSPRAWRDDRAGPLLAVFWPAAIATVLLSGFFLAGYTPALSAIGRYVTYAVPLALILMVVLLRERAALLTRASYAVAALAALGFVFRPAVQMMGEERATWGLAYRLHQLSGVGVAVGLTVVSLALVALAALVPRGRALMAATVAVALVLVVQSQAAWWQVTDTGRAFRSVMADDLEWVDHHATGDVALLAITQNAPQFDDIDFFNRKITQAYEPEEGILGRAVQGKVCSMRFDTSGLLVLGRGCGPTPHRFLINDPSARVTFQHERAAWSEPTIGRLVEVDPSRPTRARSLVVLPCPRRTPGFSASSPDIVPADAPIECARDLTAALWLDADATLVVRYRGGARDEHVTVGGRVLSVPRRVDTTVRVPVKAGYSQSVVSQSWRSSVGTPTIASVDLDDGAGGTTPLA
ncbi:MAG TPA: hypothetical protein VFG42_13225 [Baekduia sp.]|uniref:hypothetical protein n=1 Tax=Baekduia sp. TaxID=2600305 RepID=UPI002D799A66|nr:hypothetical protein [Baekduia sp.]HET6507746.1 hypothetical protein [Baekduia sp.]